MPLIKSASKKAIGKNIEKEMESGKSQKQSLAIALAVKRRASGKKKMADGGEISDADRMMAEQQRRMAEEQSERDRANDHIDQEYEDSEERAKRHMHARGGMIEQDRPKSIAEAIMRKNKMADGGEVVDIDENGEEIPNDFDELNEEAIKKEAYYDDSQIEDQPRDSNLHGHELEDEHDMVSKIRAKMRKSMM